MSVQTENNKTDHGMMFNSSVEYCRSESFYEQMDMVFDKLYEKFGLTDELMGYKNDLLHIYDNENAYKSAHILKLIKPKQWYIDETGCIRSVPLKTPTTTVK